jgi:hypothetical protein
MSRVGLWISAVFSLQTITKIGDRPGRSTVTAAATPNSIKRIYHCPKPRKLNDRIDAYQRPSDRFRSSASRDPTSASRTLASAG